MTNIYELIRYLEIKTSIVFFFFFLTILFYYLFFLITDYFLIPVVITQILNPISEVTVSIGIQTNKAKSETET